MLEDWKTYKLEELSERVTVGFVGSMAQEYVDSGIPMLRSQNIKPFSLDFNNVKYITEKFHKKIIKSSLKKDDVAIVRTGNPGTACVIDDNLGEMNCSDLVIVTPDKKKINPHFLCFYFNSIAGHYVSSQLVGAVQQHFNVGAAKQMELSLPSINEQAEIVDILKSINDKIELNLQTNKTLEEMAMTLYKHWFVDFGPFQDGNFVDSELGMIPEGWEVKNVYSLAEFINGAAFKTNDFVEVKSDGLPVIKIAEIKQGITSQTQFSNKILHPKYIIENGEILFPWSGNPHTSIGIHLWDKGKALLNQHIFVVRINEPQVKSFVFGTLINLLPTFINLATHKQTTGLGHVTVSNLKDILICTPDPENLRKYDLLAKPIMSSIFSNQIENQTLTTLRDTLLPKLISGEVRVRDAEKQLSEVL